MADVTVPIVGVILTPTMQDHLLKARTHDGRTWHLYGRSQTIAALERRGLVDQRNVWDAVLTETGVRAFSWLLGQNRVGWK